MKFFIKFIAVVLVLAAIYGAGYFTGSSRMEKLDRMMASAKSEMATKVSSLEGEIRLLRFRMQLTTARDHLIAAEFNLKERNYGTAEKELESAKEELRAAAKTAPKETGTALTGMEGTLNGVIEIIRRSDPRANVKLISIRNDLDRLIDRS